MNLTIHSDNYCGGNNVFIEIVQFSRPCHTNIHHNFKKGSNLTWSGAKLGSCTGKNFDAHYDEINFKISSTDGNDFCPKSLSISLNNGNVYTLDNMYDWVDEKQGGFLRTAKMTGKFILNCFCIVLDGDSVFGFNVFK